MTDGEWFKDMKRQMTRQIAQRMMRYGEAFDNSATEIFLEEIRALSRGLARADGLEAAERKLAIKTLWRAAGRAGEPAAITLNSMRWNSLHDAATVESPQSKPSKMKHIVFIAGADRYVAHTAVNPHPTC